MDPSASLILEPVSTPGPWQWKRVGAWVSYAQAPVVPRDATSAPVVLRPDAHELGLDLVTGVGLGSRAAIGLDVPIFLWQDGTSGLPATVSSTGSAPTSGLGDLAVLGKATLVSNDRGMGVTTGFGLALLGALTVPTGDAESFHGAGVSTVGLSLLGEYSLGVAALRATSGTRAASRRRTRLWPERGGRRGDVRRRCAVVGRGRHAAAR